MYKYLLFVLTIIIIYSCKKKDSTPTGKVIIDKNAACSWFPVSSKTSYYYNFTGIKNNSGKNVRAYVSDTSMQLEGFTFVQDSCKTIYLSYRDMQHVPIFHVGGSEIRYDSTGTTRYYTTEQLNIGSIIVDGKTYSIRQALITFTNKIAGQDSILSINYIDGIGVQSITKMKRTSASSPVDEAYKLLL